MGDDCDEVADKAEHTWNAGEVTTPATATAKGVKTYTCTACAQTKTEEFEAVTTVTAEQFAAAFNFGSNWTYVFDLTYSDNSKEHYETKRAGDLYSYYNIDHDDEGEVDYEDAYFVQKDGETVYRYDQEIVGEDEYFVKTVEDDEYEEFVNRMFTYNTPDAFKDFSLYEYDAANNCYKTKAPMDIYGTTVTVVTFTAVDGKIVQFTYTLEEDGETMAFVGNITYGDASVTLPTNLLPASMITQYQFRELFDLGENWTVTQTMTYAGMEMSGSQTYALANGIYHTMSTQTMGAMTNQWEEYVTETEGTTYIYMKDPEESNFMKGSTDSSFESYIWNEIESIVPSNFRDFSLYEYDATTGAYVGKQALEVYGVTATAFSFKVNNGKLVEFNYTITMEEDGTTITATATVTFTYGDASVTLPINVQTGGAVQG